MGKNVVDKATLVANCCKCWILEILFGSTLSTLLSMCLHAKYHVLFIRVELFLTSRKWDVCYICNIIVEHGWGSTYWLPSSLRHNLVFHKVNQGVFPSNYVLKECIMAPTYYLHIKGCWNGFGSNYFYNRTNCCAQLAFDEWSLGPI